MTYHVYKLQCNRSNNVGKDTQREHHLQRPSLQKAGGSRFLRKPVNLKIRHMSDDGISHVASFHSLVFIHGPAFPNEMCIYVLKRSQPKGQYEVSGIHAILESMY